MRHSPHLSRNIIPKTAFTLVEVLVAVVIFSIIMGSLYVVFKTSLDAWRKSNEKLQTYQNARTILEQMTKEMQAAILKGDPNTYFLLGTDSAGTNPDTITFITSIPTNEDNQYDICKIYYYLNNSNLMRRVYRDISGSGSTSTFAEGILNLQFKYWDTTTTDWSGALNAWDSRPSGSQSSRLPKAIKIEITVKEQNKKFTSIVYLVNS